RLALDEDGGVRRGDAGEGGEDPAHGDAPAEDAARVVLVGERLDDGILHDLEAEDRLAHADLAARLEVRRADAVAREGGAVPAAEIPDQEALARGRDGAMMARDGAVGEDEVVAEREADEELLTVGDLLEAPVRAGEDGDAEPAYLALTRADDEGDRLGACGGL